MWLSYNRKLKSLTAAHPLSNVLDPEYSSSEEESTAFAVKNTFMYSVFTYSLVTAKSKVPLCRHEANRDAQAVYKDLVKAYSDGTIASLSAETLENQLRNMKLDSH